LGGGAGKVLHAHIALDLAGVLHGRADLVERRLIGELHRHQGSTLEIDAVFEPTLHGDTEETSYRQNQRGNDKGPLLAQKVIIRVLE